MNLYGSIDRMMIYHCEDGYVSMGSEGNELWNGQRKGLKYMGCVYCMVLPRLSTKFWNHKYSRKVPSSHQITATLLEPDFMFCIEIIIENRIVCILLLVK